MSVTVRIAPSPTGNLHIGTARTALFNWLFARHHGGRFILRIEDTDLERSTKAYEENIIEGLRWLGLQWDNDQIIRQTERLPIYRARLEQLLDEGKAFWCHHSIAELAAEKQEQMTANAPVRHVCSHRDDATKARTPGQLIRLRADLELSGVFTDEIRGGIAWDANLIGDVSLAKNLDTPLYNFAVVIDDIDMAMTHVIRGEDHISNTPKQLMIYAALGVTPPKFAHLPLILGADRSKMSKRHGATSIVEYQKDYLPDALINFMGLLGYTYEPELMDRFAMAAQFDLARVHKSGAIFDQKKLDWVNSQYVKQLSPIVFKAVIGKPNLPDAAVPLMTERLDKLSDVTQFEYLDPAYTPQYESGLLAWKESPMPEIVRALQAIRLYDQLTQESLDALARDQFDGQKGSVYWPLRVALSGQKNSAGPLDIARVIGANATTARIDAALKLLQQ